MQIYKKSGHVAFAVLAVVSFGDVAKAGTCGYEYCFGAISAGDHGMAAHVIGQRTAADAYDRVEKICGSRCGAIEVFHSGCAMIVENFERKRFAGFGETRDDAKAEAMALCTTDSTRKCTERVAACSN